MKFMISYLSPIYQKYKTFILYSLIGSSGVILDFITFYILYDKVGMYYQYANAISVSVGITNNFILNAFFNFRVTDGLIKRFIKFYLVGLLGLAISSVILYLFVDLLFIIPLIAKVFTIGIVTIIQFTLNKNFSFKVSENKQSM